MKYEILKVSKTEDGYDVLVEHKDYGIELWLNGIFKNNDLDFDWKIKTFDFNLNTEIVRLLLQRDAEEFCDAVGTALCYLEANNFISIDDDYNILEVKHEDDSETN